MNLKNLFLINGLILSSFFISCSSAKQNPSNEVIVADYVMKGNELAQLGKYNEALAFYNKAIDLDSTSTSAKRNTGIILVRMGNYKAGIETFRNLEEYYTDDAEFLYYYGEGLRGLKLHKEAITNYKKAILLSPDDSRIIKSLSWVYIKENDLDSADKLITPFFKKRKYDLQAMLIVSTLQVKRKKYLDAIKTLRNFELSKFNIIGKDKNLVDTERILLLETLAHAYYGAKDLQKAQKLYDLVLESRSFLSSSLLGSAKCDVALKKPTEAIKKLEKALASDPNNLDVLFLLADLYKPESPEKSLFYYKRVVDLGDSDATYRAQVSISKDEISKSAIR